MKHLQTLSYVLSTLQISSALPHTTDLNRLQATCASPRLRKSWDDATASERKAYIDAAVCLTRMPSKLGLENATHHDDFAWVHVQLFDEIHFGAAFLPWHRYFVQVYEDALRTECGYNGTALYWDWVKDSSTPASSSIWDPATGLGGDGMSTDDHCVQDGPFVGIQFRYWDKETSPHCLRRQFFQGFPESALPEMLGFEYNETVFAGLLTHIAYSPFRLSFERGPHSAVHAGVGGDLARNSSTNDPVFFLHHTQVDRVWWLWQQESEDRIFAYSDDAAEVSLDDNLRMLGLARDGVVRDYMDARSAHLCYVY
jgi:tyrosinase